MGKASAAALKPYHFEPGQSGNPAGRPKGSRSKLQEAVIRALHQDFEQYGVEAIRRVRERRPEVYLTACVSLLPKQAEKIQSPFSDISDGELEALEQHLAAVRAKMVRDIDATAETAPATSPRGRVADTATEAEGQGIRQDGEIMDSPEGVRDAAQQTLDLRAEPFVDTSTILPDAPAYTRG